MPLSLVILAAGLGSRFGGNKQLEQFSSENVSLIECNVCHAIDAGFTQVCFIIRPELEALFIEHIIPKIQGKIAIRFCYQSLIDLPVGVKTLSNRSKPLGTAHAIWCCKNIIKHNFAVINGDDYYGKSAFTTLMKHHHKKNKNFAMVAYPLSKTLSENGHVNRGLCQIDAGNKLTSVKEYIEIAEHQGQIRGKQAANSSNDNLSNDALVSMNCWFFTPDIFPQLGQYITNKISIGLANENEECYLPEAVMVGIQSTNQNVEVLEAHDSWFGLTYPKDINMVESKISQLYHQKAFTTIC